MTNFNLCKVESELGIVFGFAMVTKVNGEPFVDSQNDHIPEAAMLKSSFSFMSGDRPAKKMHAGGAVGQVVYGFPLTEDIAKSLGIETPRTGFLVGVKFDDETVIQKFKTGEFTGFSIGGRRVRDVPMSALTRKGLEAMHNQTRTITKAEAESQLNSLAKNYAAEKGVTEAVAMDAVLKTQKGAELYAKYVNGAN